MSVLGTEYAMSYGHAWKLTGLGGLKPFLQSHGVVVVDQSCYLSGAMAAAPTPSPAPVVVRKAAVKERLTFDLVFQRLRQVWLPMSCTGL